MDDKGTENAAILLMSLGEEEASEVFKHLSPKEVQALGETIAKLKVISAPFVVDKVEPTDVPFWKQPWLLDIARSAIVPLAFVAIAMIAVFGMIRPAIKAATAKPEVEEKPETVDEVVDDPELLPGAGGMPRLEAPMHNEKLDRARSLARDNPVAVANIVRDWMAGEAA